MITYTPPSTSFGGPSTSHPLVLFPVRLETRFTTEDGVAQLLVRVYVEDLAVDWHEPSLTDSETEWGKAFWEQVWRSGPNEARKQAAWGQLTERFGAPRAAYVADVMRPTNDASRPGTEVAADASLSVSPVFPTPPTGPRRGPQTHVMPDRWVAIGWVDGARAFTYAGRSITSDPLQVGPSPEQSGGFDATTLADHPALGWLVDFSAAEANGMGLRIPFALPPGKRIERLVVLGAKGSITPGEGARRLADLFRAHRFTDGLSFIPQATPTNNTPEMISGYNSLDTGYETSPVADPMRYSVGDGSNLDVLSRALGIDASVFDRVRGTGVPEQRDAYHMNTLLWKASWGYALEHLLEGPGSPSDNAIRLGREHFASFVRARGPLPALRVGRQPYGVLPAISLDRWTPREGGAIDAPLRNFLVSAREVWRRGLAAIPHVPLSANPSSELLRVLAMAPTAVGYATRRTSRIIQVGTGATAPPATTGNLRAQDLASSLGMAWTPRNLRTILSATSPLEISAGCVNPIAQDEAAETLSDTEPLRSNYLQAIADGGLSSLRNPSGNSPATLLQLLTRHAGLHEYLGAAYRILARRHAVTPDARREPDVTDGSGASPVSMLERQLADMNDQQVGTVLDTLRVPLTDESGRDVSMPGSIWRRNLYQVAAGKGGVPDIAPDLTEFAAFVRALNYLAGRPSAVLASALSETIDLCSHRFDAWATSFATKRLEWLRSTNPDGVYLGGYGVVEDLAPATRQHIDPPVPDPPETPAPPELNEPLYASEGSQGYVHAPSLAHATTAAVLRSGYLSRKATDDGDALAINLSSRRVRAAMWLLDGVRQGQSLSSLLGYRFERALHENHPGLVLDRYIPSFRRLSSPDAAKRAGESDLAWIARLNSLPASSVADGLALVRKHRQQGDASERIPWGVGGLLPGPSTDQTLYAACLLELDTIEDTLDAVADLVLAESVHHVAQGNPVRAGATLEAVAHGEAPPPQIDVARTPRTGIGITHRLAVLFDATSPGTAWGPASSRALAEPHLNAWIAGLLGPDAPSARCRVEFFDPESGDPLLDNQGAPLYAEPTLADLGLAPIDLVSLPVEEATAQQSELEMRVVRSAFEMLPDAVDHHARVALMFGRRSEWPTGTLSISDVIEALRPIRRLIRGARPITAKDLALPEADVAPSADDEPGSVPSALRLSSRANAAANGLRSTTESLKELLDLDVEVIDVEALRSALLSLAGYGMTGATPITPIGESPGIRAELMAQAASVAREAANRLQRLDDIEHAYAAHVADLAKVTPSRVPSPAETRDYHLRRIEAIFGTDMPVLAGFVAPNGAALQTTFAASTALQDNRPLEAVTWLQRAARVREGAGRLHAAMLYAEALAGTSLTFSVGQLPYVPNDRWVGLPLTSARPPGGRLSLVVHAPSSVDATQPLAGILIDEWTEVVPSPEETTGLVFHYDQPSARAPHAILIAVAPDDKPTWDLETLEATVLETLELARLRTVDPPELSEATPFLPALYFASGDHGWAVTSDFDGLTSPPA